jgi:effector-binding domain-containing protein
MVPETATGLADIQDTAHVKIFYERREKTEIAEILHIGLYEEIPDSLVKLRQFIDNEGYQISGFYEEVYIVFEHIESNPYEYETLLRYEVTK